MINLIKACILTSLWLGISYHSGAQVLPPKLLPLNAVSDSMHLNPKPLIILISTEWCRYCHMQKKQLLRSNLPHLTNSQLYYIEFDAEQKHEVKFDNKLYQFKSSGLSTGIHELALALASTENGITYPTWVILDGNYKKLLTYSGVWTAKEINSVLEVFQPQTRQRAHPARGTR